MARKQQRIYDNLENNLKNIGQETASIVLKNGQVVFAKIIEIENEALIVKDMRLKSLSLPLHEISEIILEKEATK